MTFSALGFCEIKIARQKPCKLLRCCGRRCCFCLTTAKSAQKLWAIFTMFVFHWVGEKVYLSFERCWRCLLGWQRPSSSDWNTDERWWDGHEQQQRVISGCNKTGKFWHLSSFLVNTRFFSCPARAVVAVAAFVAVVVVVVLQKRNLFICRKRWHTQKPIENFLLVSCMCVLSLSLLHFTLQIFQAFLIGSPQAPTSLQTSGFWLAFAFFSHRRSRGCSRRELSSRLCLSLRPTPGRCCSSPSLTSVARGRERRKRGRETNRKEKREREGACVRVREREGACVCVRERRCMRRIADTSTER